MRYISLFSGIEAASVAWLPLGFEPVAFCENDKFPSAVLNYHYPNVPNLGDITKVNWKEVIAEYGTADIVIGGSPCQSFSIAGSRAGLDGESGLMFEYIRAIREIRPYWLLWENVPGVFSIDSGRAFGTLLNELAKLGYGLAWRVLDAQFFGVAQRRKRVFVVGSLGGGGESAAVLFERDSVSGNTKTSNEKREELTRAAIEHSKSGGKCLAFDTTQITNPDNNAHPDFGKPCHTLNANAHVPLICIASDAANAAIDYDTCGTLLANSGGNPIIVYSA